MDADSPSKKRQRVQESTDSGGDEDDGASEHEFVGEAKDEFHQRRITTEDLIVGGEHYIHTTGAPTKHNYNLRWFERLGSNCIPSASYCFEITYQADVDDLFITTQWQMLPYSISRYDRYISYCVVKTVSSPISSIVSEGDVVLRVNSQDLVQRPGDSIGLNELTQRLYQRNNTRILRLLRISAHTHSSLSVAEVLLYLEEKATPAKFCCKYLSRTTPNAKPVLESTYVDAQLPPSVKKSLQGNRINWQNVPNLPALPALAGGALAAANVPVQTTPGASQNVQANMFLQGVTMTTPIVTVHALEKYDNKQHRNVSSYNIRSGIYRDRGKFVVIYSATVQAATAGADGGNAKEKVLYNLGRYDSEEEAARILNEAKESSKASGGIFIPRHFLLGFRNTVVAPSAPSHAAHSMTAGGGMHTVPSSASLQSNGM